MSKIMRVCTKCKVAKELDSESFWKAGGVFNNACIPCLAEKNKLSGRARDAKIRKRKIADVGLGSIYG